MAVTLETIAATGKTLFFTAIRLSDGFLWNETAGAWQSSPAEADQKIAATEGTGIKIGHYTASEATWGSEGHVDIFVHEDEGATDRAIGKTQIRVTSGAEVTDLTVLDDIVADTNELQQAGPSSATTVIVNDARTWYLTRDQESNLSDQIINLTTGDAPTLAMDFADILNEDTSIVAVSSVTEVDSQVVTITNKVVSQDKTRAHFDLADQVTGTSYQFLVVVTTTDNNTLSGIGRLDVE